MPKPYFRDVFDYTVCGIPCQIGIESYLCVEPFNGPASMCWSRDDWYGYTEMEWRVLDRKGYLAPWLEAKLTDSIVDDIETAITDYYSKMKDDYYD
jgi:hypothetical protein